MNKRDIIKSDLKAVGHGIKKNVISSMPFLILQWVITFQSLSSNKSHFDSSEIYAKFLIRVIFLIVPVLLFLNSISDIDNYFRIIFTVLSVILFSVIGYIESVIWRNKLE